MDTRDGRSERALVREAVADGRAARILLAGLGVGFSLDEALRRHDVDEVVVVELEPAVVEWASTHLRGLNRRGVDDPRVRLVIVDLRDALAELDGSFDAVCLDIDNGPGWLVHAANAGIYTDAGLRCLGSLLAPDGRLTVWASAPDDAFEAQLRRRFRAVRAVAIPVPRGPADVVYVAGDPRPGHSTRAPSSATSMARTRGATAGRASRASRVGSSSSGTTATKSTWHDPRLTARGLAPAVHARMRRPSSDAATLSGWPSSSTAIGSGSASRPDQASPARTPAAIAAALEPRPRQNGTRFVISNRSPAGSAPAAANARTKRFVGSVGASRTPSPETATSTLSPPTRWTETSFRRSSATARQSNPGPRFAEDAGAETRRLSGMRGLPVEGELLDPVDVGR